MENKTKIKDENFSKLKKFSNWMAAYYFSPVYLLGSSIVNENFRDVDIIVCIDEEIFEMRFGSVNDFLESMKGEKTTWVFWKVVEENFKRFRQAYNMTNLNVDFKILPKSFFMENFKGQKIRLDESNF